MQTMTSNSTVDRSDSGDGESIADEDLLRTSLRIYGSVFLFNMFLFCILRKHFPKYFKVRSWIPELQCELATRTYGYFDWIWKLYFVDDDEIRRDCGLDALTYVRALRFGSRVSIVGIFNSIFLLAVYGTSEEGETDRVVSVTVSNLSSGSPRLLATVLAAYVLFGSTMYLIRKEFVWFTRQRHLYLLEHKPRNYTVYVSGIPKSYQSNHNLARFFDKVFSTGTVLEARVAVKTPALQKKVVSRRGIVEKLERAIDERDITGTRPTHANYLKGGAPVDTIDFYNDELGPLNEEISEEITKLERAMRPKLKKSQSVGGKRSLASQFGSAKLLMSGRSVKTQQSTLDESEEGFAGSEVGKREFTSQPGSMKSLTDGRSVAFEDSSPECGEGLEVSSEHLMDSTSDLSAAGDEASSKKGIRKRFFTATSTASSTGREMASAAISQGKGLASKTATTAINKGKKTAVKAVSSGRHVATKALSTAADVAQSAIGLKFGDGTEALNAGFVTFRKLSKTHAALQMIHHRTPFKMLVRPAPDPDDVFWHNVGRPHRSVMVGKLLSFGLTATLCVFWTVPVSGIKQLTNVEYLKENIGQLESWSQEAPFLDQFLATIAPILILILTMVILPKILERISKLEGPIAVSSLEISVFIKMSFFMIWVTFFVSAISGSLSTSEATSEVAITDYDLTALADALAERIPQQSTYFLQIIVVRATVVGLSVELLRVVPFLQAFLRGFIGPRLTEKDRQKPFFGLRPLSNPYKVRYGTVFGTDILYFMVLFVYSTMAPLVNFFLAACFLLMGSGYRYQIMCNYPKDPDSGGLLFVGFIQIIQTCMLISQVTLLGFLALKQAVGAGPFMLPLIGGTLLFNLYLRQEHYKVARFLTSDDCLSQDIEDEELESDIGEEADFHRQYVQPELRDKTLLPDNYDKLNDGVEASVDARDETTPPDGADDFVEEA